MKLLFLTPYVYAPAYEEHSKNKTGFGFMVHDIASGAGSGGNSVVMATYAFGPARSCNGFHIAKNSLFKNLIHGRYKGLLRFCLGLRKAGTGLKGLFKGAYYHLHTGYIRHLVKKEKPDLVHIHGCSLELEETIRLLRKLGVPYVVTLHGLLQDDRGACAYLKQVERRLILDNTTPLTVISSNMKARLLTQYYGAGSVDHVSVITNGVTVDPSQASRDIREKLGIDPDKQILLSVGSVCPLKNQGQTARAFAALPRQVRDNCVLLFVGTVHENAPTLQEIRSVGLPDQIRCLGFVPREELPDYYRAACLTVTASVTEGFGIPMIEGFVYGVPCVTFADLDAVGDIYDECAMHLCKERSDEALAKAMTQALLKQWDKEQVQKYSQKFSLEQTVKNYQKVYQMLKR